MLVELSLPVNLALFAVAAGLICIAGVKISAIADRLADVTGLGEAITGAILLGATTSLAGLVTSVTAAAEGYPQMAFSNAVGGIAAQTFFIAVADFVYRRANLEHAAASLPNLLNGCLLIAVLSLLVAAHVSPQIDVLGVHPVSVMIPVAYVFGLRLVSQVQEEPMWGPKETKETKLDVPEEPPGDRRTLFGLGVRFAFLAVLVGGAGFIVAESGIALTQQLGMSESLMGVLFTAVATSTPELVTTVAAVRRGALTLAVGGILGGNVFDVLFVAAADFSYREGSLYHAIGDEQLFTVALCILMTTVLLLGLLRRERHGFANVGFETVLLFALYLGGVAILALW